MASSPESYSLDYLFDSEREMNEEEISSGSSAPMKNYVFDSDEYYGDGIREMNLEEMKQYYEALDESEGFDVPSFPESYAFGIIIPWNNNISKYDTKCTEEAIKHYNNEHGTNFEIVKIVKVNHQATCGIMYYITFEVKPVGTPPEFPITVFQARVLSGIPDTIEVELCRPKPTS